MMVVFRFLSVGVGRLLGVSRYRLQPSPAQEAALLERSP
jgi:putative transposase